MLNFLKAYTDGKVREAANRTTEALALYDPKGMTEAQIQIDEKSMDEIGKRVAHTTTQYNDAKKLLDQAINLNNQRLHAAELIQSKIDAAQTGDSAAAQTASLNTLVNQIESAQSEIENFKTDASDIKSLLDDLISAYTAASTKLKNERQDLAQAQRGMERAVILEGRAKEKADAAALTAGIHQNSNTLNVALDAMKRKTQMANDAAAAANMKVSALVPTETTTDPNIASAMAQVDGTLDKATMPLADRLAALKNKAKETA